MCRAAVPLPAGLGGTMAPRAPANTAVGDAGLIPGLGRPLGERSGHPLRCSSARSRGQRSLAGYSAGAAELSTAQQQPDVPAGAWAATQTLRGSYGEPGNSGAARQKSRTLMAVELTGSLAHLAAGTGETPACLRSWLDVGHFHHNVRETSELNGGSHVHTMSTRQMSGAPGGPGSGFRLHQRQGGRQEPKWPQAVC